MATIVMVEDDELVRAVVGEALHKASHTVIAVENGADAIDVLWETDPDLVILDCALPGKAGLSILQDLRSSPKFRTLPILILTARRSDWHARLAMDVGASDYLRKPFKVADLMDRVAALLAFTPVPAPDSVGPGGADPLIDATYVETLRNSLGSADADTLLAMMVSCLDENVRILTEALDAGNRNRVLEEAHALGGAARTVGATRLATLCQLIECGVEHDHAELKYQLVSSAAATKAVIRGLLGDPATIPMTAAGN